MSSSEDKLPFVSLCTPTYNRRPFFSSLIRSIEKQTYPASRMEWIIVDDGTDSIEDLVKDIPIVKYFRYEKKMPLGEKRNVMHQKTSGDFIVYIDDDDYYPPERVSHAIETLQKNPSAMCAGSSIMHIYFKHIQQMWQFGPYGPNHATAATFAFRKELLKDSVYDDMACLGEEKSFLRNYTVPFVQLDTYKTILVLSHIHNSFDKKELIEKGENKYAKKVDVKVTQFIKDEETLSFFMHDIDKVLDQYKPGDPSNKQDVLVFMQATKKTRAEMEDVMKRQHHDMQMQANQQFKNLQDQHKKNTEEIVEKNRKLTADLKKTKENSDYIENKIKKLLTELVECKTELKRLKLNNEAARVITS